MKNWRFSIWWFLKSPWTKKYGISNTLKRYINTFFKSSNRSANYNQIYLVISCTQRTAQLLNAFLPSFNKLESIKSYKLIIVTHETEKKEINLILRDKLAVKNFNVLTTKEKFSRAHYLNLGLKSIPDNSSAFISDVDIALPKDLHKLYRKYVKQNQAWFPICTIQNEKKQLKGQYAEGVGLVGFIKNKSLRYDENIKEWGNEDWHFLYLLFDNNFYIKRSQHNGFIHHYHSQSFKKNYKKSW